MDEQKTVQALKTVFAQCGTDVLQDRRRFEACLEDLLSGSSCSTERLVLRHALDSSALTLLLRAPAFTADAAQRAVEQLRQESRMVAKDAEFVVRCVIAARGGDPNVLNETVPEPPNPTPPAAAVGSYPDGQWSVGGRWSILPGGSNQGRVGSNPVRTSGSTISAGLFHTAGLKSNGAVVAAGSNKEGRCNVGGWTDIVAIAAGWDYTVGLKSDGAVVAVGLNTTGPCNVGGWTDIVAVAAGGHTVGLKTDGTVVAVGSNKFGECDVGGWTNIAAIAVGRHTVGLKSDGTVVAVGDNESGECDVGGWTDIAAIAAGHFHTVGLRADGTMVAVGDNEYGQYNVDGWTDIVAIAAATDHTVGLKSDGTVVAVGSNADGACDVGGWRGIALP